MPTTDGERSVADHEAEHGYERECDYCGETYRTSDLTFRPYCRFMCQFYEPGESRSWATKPREQP